MLLQLAAALAPSLDLEATSLLYRSAKPLVLDDSAPQLQKRAYKVRLGVVAGQDGKEGVFFHVRADSSRVSASVGR